MANGLLDRLIAGMTASIVPGWPAARGLAVSRAASAVAANSFQVSVYAGEDPVTGKRLYLTGSSTNKAEAKRIHRRLTAQVNEQRHSKNRATLRTTIESWLETHELEETTRAGYLGYADKHIYPVLGPEPLGVFPGPGRIHHAAWEYPSMIEVAAIADLVDARGGSVLWGPLRHGMGRNVATYVLKPSGFVQEFYCDMQQIYDDARHVPGEWSPEGHKWVSLWGPHLTPEGFTELGLPPGRLR
jgi:hypothetical protein